MNGKLYIKGKTFAVTPNTTKKAKRKRASR